MSSRFVLIACVVGREGWLKDPYGYWVKRFHHDQASWTARPGVFVDEGRDMPNGEPALLKRRQCLRHEQAAQLWKALRRQGWRQAQPLWGPSCEP